ncbi:hypothetical protein [Nannocystis pusilla]|uniref:hypothetical protein n=1 Tax=Nannocystis pusilla TaxID=889268 RepID=UPI003DA2E3D0
MFEHYLDQHAPDRRRRLRLLVAAHLAALSTVGALGFTWLMGKLQIAQVAPPNASFVLVQMSLDTPLPPPPLPPAPARTEPEDKVVPEEPKPDDEPPEDFTELLPPPKPRPGPVGNGAPTATGTAPIGVPGVSTGIPGVTGLPPGFNAPTLAAPRQPKSEQRAPVPLAVVRAQGVYTPNPDQARLAATRAGMFDKRPGENENVVLRRRHRPHHGDPHAQGVPRRPGRGRGDPLDHQDLAVPPVHGRGQGGQDLYLPGVPHHL